MQCRCWSTRAGLPVPIKAIIGVLLTVTESPDELLEIVVLQPDTEGGGACSAVGRTWEAVENPPREQSRLGEGAR